MAYQGAQDSDPIPQVGEILFRLGLGVCLLAVCGAVITARLIWRRPWRLRGHSKRKIKVWVSAAILIECLLLSYGYLLHRASDDVRSDGLSSVGRAGAHSVELRRLLLSAGRSTPPRHTAKIDSEALDAAERPSSFWGAHTAKWLVLILAFVGLELVLAGLVLVSAPVWLRFKPGWPIRVGDLEARVGSFSAVVNRLHEKESVAIGVSLKSNEVISIPDRVRNMHMLVSGASGTGKTTLMKVFIAHAVRHGYPCIIVEPKGDQRLLEELRPYIESLPNGKERLKVFSIRHHADSARYNPLRSGSSISKKDRIMSALNWSETYYNVMASDYLSAALPALEFLGLSVSIPALCDLLQYKERVLEVRDLLARSVKEGKHGALEMSSAFSTVVNMPEKEIRGLRGQLRSIANEEFGYLFRTEATGGEDEIHFDEAIERGQIIFFQLNVLGYPDISRSVGRFILEDLKATTDAIYGNKSKRVAGVVPVCIDEFDEFKTEEFASFLKMCRGAFLGLNLFIQGPEDLEGVSIPFKDKVMNNTIVKVLLRHDEKNRVDALSGLAGTMDAVERSEQVRVGLLGTTRTGLGNQRMTKQMIVEHDVFKNLQPGQAIYINKATRAIDLVQLWNPEIKVVVQ